MVEFGQGVLKQIKYEKFKQAMSITMAIIIMIIDINGQILSEKSTWVFAPGELKIQVWNTKNPLQMSYSFRNIFKLINSVNNHTNVFENEKKSYH